MTKEDILNTCSINPIAFGKLVSPNAFSVKSPDFHLELASLYMDKAKSKINIEASRGHAKTTLVGGIFVLHHLFADKSEWGKQKLVVLVSKTEGHAIRMVQTIKDILNYSRGFRALYGYHGEQVARGWKQNEVVLDTNDMIIARGTGQMVVGLKHGNQRPTFIVCDDLEDMNNTKTPEAMEFNLRWLLQSLVPARDPLRGRVMSIATPQHQRCICETLKGASDWTTVVYPALRDKEGKADINGEPLWPEWWSREALLKEREAAESIGRVSMFYREFLCMITGDEDQIFKEEDMRYYEGDVFYNNDYEAFLTLTNINGENVNETRALTIFMGVDPASATTEKADSTAIVITGVDKWANRFVLGYVNRKMKPMAVANEIITQFLKWHPFRTRIESNGYQEMLRDYLKQETAARGMFIPGLEIKEIARDKKSKRIESLQPYFAQHKLFMRKDAEDLKQQLLMYPKGAHDDLLDGLFYSMKNTHMPHHEMSRPQNQPANSTEFLLCEYSDVEEVDDPRFASTEVEVYDIL